ncbi:murein hydrolase activator EnvC family protein [Pseudoduganella ginsengisoli]|uniref:Peptidoglycan DD-metalloendopeptidase family protein n=1 Tax=Pseudoduganella ginsengisoli TaxID=1462440 RepID=A0A6L6Q1L0_9BURK|nr:peptidoglycan DD-metalloendopeptidase family protein [Pseudoduganella ginsengisoli]MTW03525.1 peptidoglycan DD-metalloendopeptidase family protein [Pseudoduganella ginsengisoli]
MAAGAAHAAVAKPTERSKQKAAAEAERAELQQKLNALKRDIGKTESAREDAADTLAESEEAISKANRTLRELADEQAQTNARLTELAAEHTRLQATVNQQKQQLAKLLREHYVAGNEDRIKLLLSGDNPNRINRDLQMMAYVSQAQARLLESLRANLKAVESNQAEAENARNELEEIAQEERHQKSVLEQEKAKRAAVLASLSQRLVSQRKEAGKLAQDEQRMGALVDSLNKLIEEQARAAAAEKRRLEALAAAKAKAEAEARAKAKAEAEAKARQLAQLRAKAQQAEKERLAKQGKPGASTPLASAPPVPAAPTATPVKPAPDTRVASVPAAEPAKEPVKEPAKVPAKEPAREPAKEPAATVAMREPIAVREVPNDEPPARPARAADVALAPAAAEGAFAALKGQLRPPVAGKIGARFGAKRGDGPSWKGMFIRTAEGTQIHAIAAGRVVFAQWLRGYGNLIIVDHGGQYWSIYGNNQSLLRREGDAVKSGDVIAAAGNTGGNEESGLYFELRHRGKEFDPASWVKF